MRNCDDQVKKKVEGITIRPGVQYTNETHLCVARRHGRQSFTYNLIGVTKQVFCSWGREFTEQLFGPVACRPPGPVSYKA